MVNNRGIYAPNVLRVAIYIRVSTQEQAKEGYSIGEQEERLRKYCEAQNWNIVDVFSDPGFSGGSTNRPGLKSLIETVKSGNTDKVIVYKLDRLSRSQKDTLYLIEDVFLANNVDFVSMTENFDTATPFGKAMIGILSVFAQLEREQIKERMNIGKEGRAKEGLFHGSKWIPIGYDYIDGLLVVNEYEKMQVNEIVDLILAGTPLRTIETMFIEKGYKHKYGAWSPKTIRRVLRNKTSLGYNKYRDEWYPGKHDPILTEERYNAVNEILDKQRQAFLEYGYRPGGNHTTLLGGLLYCARCGGRYAKNTGGSKKYGQIDYYACYSRSKKVKKMIKDPNCKNDYIRVDKLDDLILGEIKKLALDPEYFDTLKENDRPDQDNTDRRKIIESQIDKIDNQINRLMDLYALGNIPIETIDKKTQELSQDRNKLTQELENLEIYEPELSREDTIEIASTLEDCLESGDLDEIRSIITALIERIEIDGEDITIHWKFN